ncbi:beta-1,4-N-acetylgalactosaminyltransferase 3-like isoform X1 [Paramormyrops kingsleyae]|uniref:beta-1,4-N-acetylgalactosaminyltransferase 3-like isoform X1 n=2 Tax=Paramormyrops kingsleyae TaxID=1676925 RepID=UPI003B97CE6B
MSSDVSAAAQPNLRHMHLISLSAVAKMLHLFHHKNMRRIVKYLIFTSLLIVGLFTTYFYLKENAGNYGLGAKQKDISKEEVFRDERNGSHQREANRSRPWKPEYMGKANLHVFEDWCGSSTHQLRKNPHYPLYPNSRITVKKLAVSPMWTNYGLRIFGYLHPRKSGEYLFAVASDDGSEFWLSLDSSPLNLHLQASVGRAGMDWTAPGEFNKYASQISSPVHLSAEDFYFFEVIHKQNDRGTDHLEVAWRLNQDSAPFEIIGSEHISMYIDETDLKLHEVSHIPQTPASSFHWRTYARVSSHGAEMLREDPRDSFYHVPLMSASNLRGILPVCPYSPTYLIKGYPLQRYQGIEFVHLSYVYPNDYTRLTHMETNNKCLYSEDPHYLEGLGFLNYMKMDSPENGSAEQRDNEQESENYESTSSIIYDPVVNWAQTINVSNMDFSAFRKDSIDLKCNVSGNLQMSSRVALPIVQAFMHQLNQENLGHFTLLQVVNVEQRIDNLHGSRYLLELVVQDRHGTKFRISQYVYEPHSQIRVDQSDRNGALLCYPEGVEWNPSATVHIILPVKNQARWVQQFIMYMEDIYNVTGDKNFNIIIVDYSSKDMDVEQALQSAHIPRYQYVKLTGNFERSAALQAGINLITDSHSIAFLCDLHMYFPHSIIDSIRKHCVEGKITFAPIIMRLDCGATPEEPDGYWEVNGFGLLGIYKSDMDRVGGMNMDEYRDHWGGEDWELIDRVLHAGLEVDRIYIRNFLHFYHSKRGMWNRRFRKPM